MNVDFFVATGVFTINGEALGKNVYNVEEVISYLLVKGHAMLRFLNPTCSYTQPNIT